jgi:hypothetical protein
MPEKHGAIVRVFADCRPGNGLVFDLIPADAEFMGSARGTQKTMYLKYHHPDLPAVAEGDCYPVWDFTGLGPGDLLGVC